MSVLERAVAAGLRRLRRWRTPVSGRGYWEARAAQFGPRSVLNLAHPPEAFEAVTRRQREELFPHLARALRGGEGLALDFGCGPGRFTAGLAALIGCRAIGLDIVDSFLGMAPKSANVEYRLMREGEIDLESEDVDVVWVCLVLGGIKPPVLLRTAAELVRVLKPGGLLFLVENTSDQPDCEHWSFRTVAEYQALFSRIPLMPVHEYMDLDERVTAMAGRKG